MRSAKEKKPPQAVTAPGGRKAYADRLMSGAWRIFDASQTRQLGYAMAIGTNGSVEKGIKADDKLFYGFVCSAFEGEPLPEVYKGGFPRLADAIGALMDELARRK